MTETVEQRIDRIMRELLNTHVDLLALLLAEAQVPPEVQIERLDQLVRTISSREMKPTLFDGGRRVAYVLDLDSTPARLELNEELLERVDDNEILFALAAPIAQLLELSQLSVAIALQAQDERHLRNLATKASRRLDTPMARATDVSSYVDIKMKILSRRLEAFTAALGHPRDFNLEASDELREALRSHSAWPEWVDVSQVEVAARALRGVHDALQDTEYAAHGSIFIEQLWESLGVSPQSFFRNAGRRLRSENVENLEEVLKALAASIARTDAGFSDRLRDWKSYSEIYEAWSALARVEKTLFGISDKPVDARPVSVLEPVGVAFGITEPDSLPLKLPLVCWSAREYGALRDLFCGHAQTMPGAPTLSFASFEELYETDTEPLDVESSQRSVSIQMIALDSDVVPADPRLERRAFSSTLNTLLTQFDALPNQHQVEAIRMVRRAYDDYFPERKRIWARRFHTLQRLEPREAYRAVLTEITQALNVPVVFDPIVKPSVTEVAPFPTLTFVVPLLESLDERSAFWIPLSALSSTASGAPLRLRIVETPSEKARGCGWCCDRTLNLSKLEAQPLDLIARSIYGDCLHFAVNP